MEIELVSYNIHGQKLRSGIVVFDFENKTMTTGKNTYSVVPDYTYTYKLSKRNKTILASGGVDGLYKFLNEINSPKSPFNPCYTDIFINEF